MEYVVCKMTQKTDSTRPNGGGLLIDPDIHLVAVA